MSIKLVLMSRFTWNSCSPNDPGEFRECFPPSLDQTQQTVRSASVLKVTSSHASCRIGICSCVRLCSCIARKKWHVAVVLVGAPNTANNTKPCWRIRITRYCRQARQPSKEGVNLMIGYTSCSAPTRNPSVSWQTVDYEQSLFFLGPSSKTPETRKRPCAWLKARDGRGTTAALVSRVSRLRRSTLARACTLLTKSEENERLLRV